MKAIEEFLTYLKVEQRCSRLTIEAYGRDLRTFSEWLCGGRGSEEFDAVSVTISDVRAWVGSLAERGIAPASLRRKVQSLRAFYRWGMKTGRFRSNPAADITLAKKPKPLPNFIKEKDIEDLLAQTPYDFESERTHIILSMLYSLGLRQAELLALTDNDISLTSKEIHITGKRNKQRVVPLPGALADEIIHWQKIRDGRYPGLDAPRPLIAGPHGFLSKENLYRIVRDGLASVSSGRKSPHTLRHTFATAMINNGADLDAVREILGHESLATTQVYTHLSFRELLANYTHPRSIRKIEADTASEICDKKIGKD